jgi:hypothetical protein
MELEQGRSQVSAHKAWPEMTGAERRAIWDGFQWDETTDVEDFIAHVERGRDEADRELPLRVK